MRTKGYFPGRIMRRTREWRKSLSSLLCGYTDLWYFSTLCYILTCEVHYMRLTSKFSKLISEKYLDIPSPQKVLSFHQQWKRRTIRHFLIVTGRLGEADPQPEVLLGNIEETASFPLTICITYCHGDWKVPKGKKKTWNSSYWNSDINCHVWWVGGPDASQIIRRSHGASEGTFQPHHKVSISQS